MPEAEQEQRADGPKVQADDHQEADHPEHGSVEEDRFLLFLLCPSPILPPPHPPPPPPDYRLNPVLRKACRADIPKFCQSILNKVTEESELEGQVIGCLKLKYADQVSPTSVTTALLKPPPTV